MEFLRRLGEPILDRLRSLPLRTQVTGLFFGLFVATGLWMLAGRTPPTEFVALMEGRELSEPQIARMTTAFRKHRLDGARITGRTIEIPRAEKDAYLMALDGENAWPANFDAPVDRALAGTNPLMPWQQSRENLERGEKQMLARIVEEMNGIENAAVQYDEIRQPGFPPRIEVRAVVAVKAVGQRHLEADEIEAIRDTVVAFKSGLERESVTITDLNACRAYPGSRAPDNSQAVAHAVATAKRTLEDELRGKIEKRLSMYPRAIVAVNAHFSQPAFVTQRVGTIPAGDTFPTCLVQVTASIDIPRSYFVTVWKQRSGATSDQIPPPEKVAEVEREICGNIQRAVTAMLPPPAPGWRAPQLVTVTSYDELPPPSETVTAIPDLPLWAWIAATAFLLSASAPLAIWLYVRLRTSTPTNVAIQPGDEGRNTLSQSRSDTSAGSSDPPPSFVQLRDQLKNMVQQDPRSAAEVLKQWLGRAA